MGSDLEGGDDNDLAVATYWSVDIDGDGDNDAKFISCTCDGILECLTEADINQSGGSNPTCSDITIGDIVYLQDYLFITGPELGQPDCR